MRLIDKLEPYRPFPVSPLMGFPGVKATGNSMTGALTDTGAHLASLRFLEDRYHPPCLFSLMDLTVEAEALGLPISFVEGGPPSVVEHPVDGKEKLLELRVPDPSSSDRMPLFLRVASSMGDFVRGLPGSYVIGPFTLAGELVGAEELAVRTIVDPVFSRDAVRFCAEIISTYAGALAEAGARVVTVLEPTAVILSSTKFKEYCSEPLSGIASRITALGSSPLLHVCGDSTHLLEAMGGCGFEGLSLDSPVDLGPALEKTPSDTLIIGNIDLFSIMVEGSARDVEEAARGLSLPP